MVKRWNPLHRHMVDTSEFSIARQGEYVLYSDYQALQKALEEALKGWDADINTEQSYVSNAEKRISQLRSLYLGGGK